MRTHLCVVQNEASNIDQFGAPFHGPLLHQEIGVFFTQLLFRHQFAFGAFDGLSYQHTEMFSEKQFMLCLLHELICILLPNRFIRTNAPN
jgi:hypothetical protein